MRDETNQPAGRLRHATAWAHTRGAAASELCNALGSNRPSPGAVRPNSARCGPCWARFDHNSARFGKVWARLGQRWTRLNPCWARFVSSSCPRSRLCALLNRSLPGRWRRRRLSTEDNSSPLRNGLRTDTPKWLQDYSKFLNGTS